MNFNLDINRFFQFLIYFSTLTIYVKADSYGTFNFDQENFTLIDMKKNIENQTQTIGHNLAIACPAQSTSEKDFNSDHSLGKNSLFVRGIFGRLAQTASVPVDICDDVYKVSISYHRPNREIVFGYEVYYDAQQYSGFTEVVYSDFESIANAFPKMGGTKRKLSYSTTKLKLSRGDGNTTTLGFLWVLIFRLKFDYSLKNPIQVIYTLSKYTEIGITCEDYSMGNEIYTQDVDSLYEDQVKLFKKIEIPAPDFECDKKNNCLTKYSLIPAEEFRFRSPEPKSIPCSNLTTVPIWTRTAQGILQKLDKFLYALVKFTYNYLDVISGVHGQLQMKRLRLRGTTKITIGDNGEIPVPNIIYKIVHYEFKAKEKVNDADYYKITNVLEAVIIVVHNDPEFNPQDAICPLDNCEKWGWSEILKESILPSRGPSSNYIYCCPKSEEIVEILDMEYDDKFSKELNLKHFPVYDDQSLKMRTTNILQELSDEMQRLFGQ